MRYPTLVERFWKYTQKTDGCWPWSGAKTQNGYGKLVVKRGTGQQQTVEYHSAHRLSWQVHHGAIPEGAFVCHRCDNPPCVNPAHLFLGTHGDNMQDMVAKGRARRTNEHRRKKSEMAPRGDAHWARKEPSLVPRGESRGQAKMTDDQALEALRAWRCGSVTQTALAARYGVSLGTMNKLVLGRKWRHIHERIASEIGT